MPPALRSLAKSPGFTVIAVITLALGIGANTAIFSVINSVLLRPLAYDQPDRLMNVWESSQQQNLPRAALPPGNVFDLFAQNSTFASMAAWTVASLNLAGDDFAAERFEGAQITADLAAVLRIAPARGRFFAPDEFTPGNDGVILLSHGVWQQRFAADPKIVGRTLPINGRPRTVVGVMPEGFNYPGRTVAWVPYAPDVQFKQRRDFRNLRVIGRLKDGVTYDQARADLQQINRQLAAQFPATSATWFINAYPMLDDAVASIRPALRVLVAAVGVLLLIACANVANLLLARAAGREQEIAVRISLGATRAHIVRQLLAESLVLFALGGAGGVLLAQWGLGALLALAPAGIPRLDQVSIDTTALLFTSAVALVTGLAFGLIPAWQGSRTDLTRSLRAGDRGATANRGRVRSALVVLQVSAAVTLLVVAGLLLRSFDQVRRVNPGFNPDGVFTFRLDLPPGKFDSAEKRSVFLHEIVRALAALPGVQSAGATTSVPLSGGPTFIMRFEGRPPVTPSNAPSVRHRVATADYFRTMGMTLVRGRGLTAVDAPGAPPVCVINQTLAQKHFPHEDPIGKRLEIGFADPPAWREIVGIVADVKTDGLDTDTPVQVFEPLHQWAISNYSFVVRLAPKQGEGGTAVSGVTRVEGLAASIRAAVQSVDRTQPVHGIKPMTQFVTESLAQRTFALVLLVVFACVAFALAVIGLYGVIAYSVAQRTREFGIRLALGATANNVLQLVLRQGVALIAFGLALGLVGALGLGRFVATLLFGVEPHDPATFIAIAALLAVVALVACLVPALRATKVDPITALRAE